jgi:hypothetical protein
LMESPSTKTSFGGMLTLKPSKLLLSVILSPTRQKGDASWQAKHKLTDTSALEANNLPPRVHRVNMQPATAEIASGQSFEILVVTMVEDLPSYCKSITKFVYLRVQISD